MTNPQHDQGDTTIGQTNGVMLCVTANVLYTKWTLSDKRSTVELRRQRWRRWT